MALYPWSVKILVPSLKQGNGDINIFDTLLLLPFATQTYVPSLEIPEGDDPKSIV